ATTVDEFRKHFETDAALGRRFQPLQVDQPSIAVTVEMLKGLRDRYEAHHRGTITDEPRAAAATLAEPYVSGRDERDRDSGTRDGYDAHHRVTITDEALAAAANLADRYVSDRYLPDKAIDLIDEAGSRLRIRKMTAPPDLREFDEQIADVRRRKEGAIDAQDF